MSKIAPHSASDNADPEVELAANVLKSALTGVPVQKRAAVVERLTEMLAPMKAPKRGNPVLNNVVDLFKQRAEWTAGEVVAALKEKGVPAQSKQVYGALTYLSGAKILRRVGYGKYLIEGGALMITHDMEA